MTKNEFLDQAVSLMPGRSELAQGDDDDGFVREAIRAHLTKPLEELSTAQTSILRLLSEGPQTIEGLTQALGQQPRQRGTRYLSAYELRRTLRMLAPLVLSGKVAVPAGTDALRATYRPAG